MYFWGSLKTNAFTTFLLCGICLSGFLSNASGQAATSNLPISNLLQIAKLLNADDRIEGSIKWEGTVCAASQPSIGVVILKDETDTELLEFNGGVPELLPGNQVQITCTNCLLRRRKMGVQITPRPVVDNDGIHAHRTTGTGIALKKGRHTVVLEWFNRLHVPDLELTWQLPGSRYEDFPFTNFFYMSAVKSGPANFQSGILAECYEGDWEQVPNFDLLEPIKTVIATNFEARTRNEMVGTRYVGFFDAPAEGDYRFRTRSADGSLLFIDNPGVAIKKVGESILPKPVSMMIGQHWDKPTWKRWAKIEGRVGSIEPNGRGLEMTLYSGQASAFARIFDASGLSVSNLLNSRICITGVASGSFDASGEITLRQLAAANAESVEVIRSPNSLPDESSFLTKAEQVQNLPLDDARRHLPVHLRGVVTSIGRPQDNWLTVQDDTRGIFVSSRALPGQVVRCGDFYDVFGHTGGGDFAPVVEAEKLVRLGSGELPQPVHPTWDELNNGSMDVQWVEVKGLVTDVQKNQLAMLRPGGQMNIQVEGPSPFSLQSLNGAVARIRGVMFAEWNASREVRVGSIVLRNAHITVDTPLPADPFDVAVKTPRELLLFDSQATPFQRVKVRGQIIYADANQVYLQEKNEGLRILPAAAAKLKPGDLVEAVGYPNISKSFLILRQAIIHKTGETNLPPQNQLSKSLSNLAGLDSTRVRIEGELLGWHFEQAKPVLEMQSATRLFLARLPKQHIPPLRTGSQLALDGVFVNLGINRETGPRADAFELLLNSPADIQILSQPPWWTLGRLLMLVGVLLFILIVSALWITQLRRLVAQRTSQLQREIREREQAEKQRALEVERSRIARDLHDDLGASLTEIAVLASKGQRTSQIEQSTPPLFRAITSKARELVAALDIIVWAVDPKDNSLQSVADYLCDFTEEYLSPSGIACRFDVPVTLPSVILDGRLRHSLFLAVKETLNNIVRHSQATEVEFRLAIADGRLEISILDNGKGFDAKSPQIGKGQKNLSARLSEIGGCYELHSIAGKGTTVRIELRLPDQGTGRPGE